MLRPASLFVLASLLLGGGWSLIAEQPSPADARKAAQKAQADGNFRDAFEAFERLCLDPANSTSQAVDDLQRAIQCLMQLQRLHDVDGFLEKVVVRHPDHWRVLAAA